MEAIFFHKLSEKMNEWLTENCQKKGWPEFISGDWTTSMMAQAASAVFDGIVESQECAKEQGYWKET